MFILLVFILEVFASSLEVFIYVLQALFILDVFKFVHDAFVFIADAFIFIADAFICSLLLLWGVVFASIITNCKSGRGVPLEGLPFFIS